MDGATIAAPPALCAARREILVYLAALASAGRPAPSLKDVAQETCVTIPVAEVRRRCSHLRAAQLIDWRHIFEPGKRHDNEVTLTSAGFAIAIGLLQAAGADAPRFPRIEEKNCLGCGTRFRSDGPHNKVCPAFPRCTETF